jgi:regulator of RNase E activity RraA
MTTPLTADTRAKLAEVSTATLTTQLFKRGLRNLFIQNVGLLNPAAPRLVGEAFTLRFIPAREDLDHIGVLADPEHPQRKAIEAVPPGQVLVMDCRGDARAASGGGILITRLMMRGVAGVVTDAGIRDSAEIAALDFPVYCAGPSAPLNLVHHHAVDTNRPIACGGVPVYPGDVVVGDRDGVVVVPRDRIDAVINALAAIRAAEAALEAKVQAGLEIPDFIQSLLASDRVRWVD